MFAESRIHNGYAMFKGIALYVAWGLCLLTPSLLSANPTDFAEVVDGANEDTP